MTAKSVIQTIIVDDEEPARLLLREYLTKRDDIHITAECSNGFEAVKALTELKPDLAILDIQMPKASGIEVTRWVRANLRGDFGENDRISLITRSTCFLPFLGGTKRSTSSVKMIRPTTMSQND